MLNIANHPGLLYADELQAICQPLKKLNISYFGYAYIDLSGRFSTLNNHPDFLEYYFKHQYYNVDTHLAKSDNFDKYIIMDALELKGRSKKLNQEAAGFGLKHFFTIINKGQQGTHYYHFANNSNNSSINQFYINNIDLLNLFTQYFTKCVEESSHLSRTYQLKYSISNNAPGFSFKEDFSSSEIIKNKSDFISDLDSSSQLTPILTLTPQQNKCVNLLMNGFSSKQIAAELNLSTRTVENYLNTVRAILRCRNSREIIARYRPYLNVLTQV